jgi:hypothetical protein
MTLANNNIRASDENRSDTCEVLDAALEDGQLSAEEHRERVSAATKATTLGELEKLVTDLQIHRPAAHPQTLRSPRGVLGKWFAVAGVVLVLAFGITWALMSGSEPAQAPPASKNPSSSNISAATSAPAPAGTSAPAPPELLNLTGVTGLLAQMRSQFGDTLGYQLNIYSDKAVLLRPDTANPRKTIQWLFRNNSWTNMGASTAVGSGSGIGDLSTFDVQAVLGAVNSAPQTLQLYDAPQTFLAIQSRREGGLYLNIHVSDNTRRSGSLVVGPDGSVKEVQRPPH